MGRVGYRRRAVVLGGLGGVWGDGPEVPVVMVRQVLLVMAEASERLAFCAMHNESVLIRVGEQALGLGLVLASDGVDRLCDGGRWRFLPVEYGGELGEYCWVRVVELPLDELAGGLQRGVGVRGVVVRDGDVGKLGILLGLGDDVAALDQVSPGRFGGVALGIGVLDGLDGPGVLVDEAHEGDAGVMVRVHGRVVGEVSRFLAGGVQENVLVLFSPLRVWGFGGLGVWGSNKSLGSETESHLGFGVCQRVVLGWLSRLFEKLVVIDSACLVRTGSIIGRVGGLFWDFLRPGGLGLF